MGLLHEMHGLTLVGKTPEGTCPECAVKHAPEQPHKKDSLCYQYKFYDRHGRWPTWTDAMAHCPEEVKEAWTAALQKVRKAACEQRGDRKGGADASAGRKRGWRNWISSPWTGRRIYSAT